MSVLIVGVSTRAAAESAALAGFDVTSIDAFDDLDQHSSVRSIPLDSEFSCARAAQAAVDLQCDAVVYLASFENHPEAVMLLGSTAQLWGNPPDVLRRVRDPSVVQAVFSRNGHGVPRVGTVAADGSEAATWLIKPRSQGGGHGVRRWVRGEPVPRDCYLQEFVAGIPGAVVFVAAAGRALTLGVTRQLIGDNAFGVSGFRYCGSILVTGAPADMEAPSLAAAASALASTAASEFGLVGVNGIDFVVSEGLPHVVEVNPRWCASMELVEQAHGLSVFGAHASACSGADLNWTGPARREAVRGAWGKAIVFARDDVTVGDSRSWCSQSRFSGVRDVPRPGQRIRAGRPVCTVFARGSDEKTCYAALVEEAAGVYAELDPWVKSE